MINHLLFMYKHTQILNLRMMRMAIIVHEVQEIGILAMRLHPHTKLLNLPHIKMAIATTIIILQRSMHTDKIHTLKDLVSHSVI